MSWHTARQRVTLGLTAPNVYALTVDTALAIARHCLSMQPKGGYVTPSMLLGADFTTTRPDLIVSQPG